LGYDDGVNIAARVEQLAGPGEICVSRTVHDHAKAKVAFGFAPMGEHRVKNIPEPVTVYRVITEPGPLAQALGLKRAGTRRWRFGMVAGAVVLLVAAGGAGLWLRLNDAPTVALQQAATPVTTSTSPVVAQQAPLDKYRIAVLPFAPGEKRQLKEQVTQNLEAYHLYLQGLHLFHRMTEEGLNNSIAYFERALQHDPNFAQAYAGIAMAYMQLGFISLLGPRDAFEKARVAAEKALEFDDTIVDAQLVAATAGQILDYDQARAKLAYERAVEVAPNSALAHDFYGIQYLSPMGQHQEAIAESGVRLSSIQSPCCM
jgi:hypothetical protein